MSAAPQPGRVNLHCRNVQKVFEYLTGILEFTPEFRVKQPEGGSMFAGVTWGKVGQGPRISLGDIHEALHGEYDHGEFGKQMEQHPLGTGVVLYYYVNGVDEYYKRIAAKGAEIDEPPTNQFWGDRTISVIVPEGYYMTFAEPIMGFRFPARITERLEMFAPQTTSTLPTP